jgi:FAD binding domain
VHSGARTFHLLTPLQNLIFGREQFWGRATHFAPHLVTECGAFDFSNRLCAICSGAQMRTQHRNISISFAAVVAVAILGGISTRPQFLTKLTQNHSTSTAKTTVVADDVSRLNSTAIHETWDIPADEGSAQSALRELLKQAGSAGIHVSIAGAHHSMGGQTIAPGGIRVNMRPLKSMKLDQSKDVLHVDAGALWAEVIPYLDQHGRSVEVMQSDNSFTVGGSLSVNCHGWQYGRAPIASTVESFHLMKADGTVVR